ncbi:MULTISPECIES: ATP-binding cassette domain-containing protein [Ensifer]|jgi:putative thiamine transport system ATP-binding protein|uniref:ATP-binding cassette domain-containing protein n=1 Tax=Ensifer canadensis TaxID=555315 RepID=A0AAW4FT34_9HYPH|nr:MULTISPECIES: ATP-binding cassette domain-containing protein [Ensifer]AHK42915.1 putative ABC transporter, ATP-binding protein [Ensifer adhaerens OV14]MBD9490771.1 ATP-binding cassette domain-containing protein [Ensifer sp. ENS11]KQU92737.1 ABC transporter ATP-binding protein [Ensifer sp. Root31]KQW50042.1 ABC transporter ATP-binding protein [Ensifer sp. Root1252]KQW67668.1 ABC transporter ATP-binding protein [Ensifer sp. Root127]
MRTPGKTMPLTLSDVTIRLADRLLLSVSATVMPGDVLTIMGPSGSGKSTLLAYIGGFLDPAFTASGAVLLGQDDLIALRPQQRHTGILFQDPLLFPHLSVGGNIVFAIPEAFKDRDVRRRMAENALDEGGLGGFFDRDPETLSGGQKARVALQRVLLSEPRLLLLDEPFSKLDMALRQQTRELVFAKARSAGLPTILVTHDRADADAAGGALIHIGAERQS